MLAMGCAIDCFPFIPIYSETLYRFLGICYGGVERSVNYIFKAVNRNRSILLCYSQRTVARIVGNSNQEFGSA